MTEPNAPDRGPGISFPPPLLFAGGFVVGWLIGRFWPLWAASPVNPIIEVTGAVVAGAGLAIVAWAMSTFALSRTATMPNRPASTLVTHGPYRYSRNPMYVAMTLLYIGLALTTRIWWALPVLPIVLVVLSRVVVAREERYLGTAFGEAYAQYMQRVRRWI